MLKLRRYFQHFCQSGKAFPLTLLAGLILVLPSLWSGLFADDFTHVVLIREGSLVRQPDNLSLFHLFSFIDTQPERLLQLRGLSIMPWWISEHFSLLFFRPLSELTHYLDYQWLYPQVGLMHLHSLLWYAILLAMLAWFYQTFCASRQLALLALLFFIADATHGFTVAWLANRNALLAAIFTLLALISHHRFRHTRKTAWQVLSLAGIACCFLSAEAGIVVGAFLFAYAVFLDRDGPARGLLALAPALLIFLAWLLLYKHYGYGAHGNKAYYVDPLSSPLLFLLNLPERLLRTIAIQFNPLPIHLARPFRPLMIATGLVFLILLVIPALLSKNRHYRFFLCSMLLAIIPITSAEVQDRNMLFVGIAASPILAVCIRYLSRCGQRLAIVLAAVILFFHLPVSALLMLPTSYGPKLMAHSSVTTAASLPADSEQQYVISLGIPVFDASYIAAIRRSQSLPLPQRLWNVSTQTRGLSIERLDDHHFRLHNPDGLLGGIDFMLRDMSFDPVRNGETFKLNGLILRIEALNDAGTPVQASLQIDPGIAADQIQLCYWKNMKLEPFTLTIGEKRTF